MCFAAKKVGIFEAEAKTRWRNECRLAGRNCGWDMLDAEADALQYHNLSAGAAFTLSVRGVLDDALERANKLMESAE